MRCCRWNIYRPSIPPNNAAVLSLLSGASMTELPQKFLLPFGRRIFGCLFPIYPHSCSGASEITSFNKAPSTREMYFTLLEQIRIHNEGGSDFLGFLGTFWLIRLSWGDPFSLRLASSLDFICSVAAISVVSFLEDAFACTAFGFFLLIILNCRLFSLFYGLFNSLFLRLFLHRFCLIGFTHEAIHQ